MFPLQPRQLWAVIFTPTEFNQSPNNQFLIFRGKKSLSSGF